MSRPTEEYRPGDHEGMECVDSNARSQEGEKIVSGFSGGEKMPSGLPGSGKMVQAGDHSALETGGHLYDSYRQPTTAPFESRLFAEKDTFPEPKRNRRICHLRPRYFWSLIGLAVVIIAVVVGVAVGVSVNRAHHQTSQKSSNPQASGTPAAQGVPTNSGSPAAASSMKRDTSLASLAWNDTDNVAHSRLYWQEKNGGIMESFYNTTLQNWTVSSAPIGYAKPGSPIAAAVIGPGNSTFVSCALWTE